MFVKLENNVIKILACPLCKGVLKWVRVKYICQDCGTKYLKQQISQKGYTDYTFDFCVHRPTYCIPDEAKRWIQIQEGYKNCHHNLRLDDDLGRYLDEVDSVKEIYEKEFQIRGKVLDVGGGKGTLRYFLKDEEIKLYVSIDPYSEIFQNLDSQPNLLKTYQCLYKPCNFLLAQAENLPFKKNSFDWVHMRSVLDHFYDPYLALKEAFRVLMPDGLLLIGLFVQRGQTIKSERNANWNFLGLTKETFVKIVNVKKNKVIDDHMFHWQYTDLLDLLNETGFKVIKKHWQKPPFANCIYISAKKIK